MLTRKIKARQYNPIGTEVVDYLKSKLKSININTQKGRKNYECK